MRLAKLGSIAAATFALTLTSAPASVTVGTFTTGNCYPALCNDSGSDVGQAIDWQEVYSASAFPGALTIESITFFFDPAFGGSSNILSGDYNFYLSYSANPVGGLSTTLADNVSGVQALFFTGHTDGTDSADPSATIIGTPFFYDPANGDLLLEVVASNQANVPNGPDNGFFQADGSAAVISRAFCVTGLECDAGSGALVTEFNAALPEPLTLSLFGAGLAGAAFLRRRKQKPR